MKTTFYKVPTEPDFSMQDALVLLCSTAQWKSISVNLHSSVSSLNEAVANSTYLALLCLSVYIITIYDHFAFDPPKSSSST